jgi:hypothetical protein
MITKLYQYGNKLCATCIWTKALLSPARNAEKFKNIPICVSLVKHVSNGLYKLSVTSYGVGKYMNGIAEMSRNEDIWFLSLGYFDLIGKAYNGKALYTAKQILIILH